MRSLRRFLKRVSNLAIARRSDQRLRQEIAEHIALQEEANVRNGMSPGDARHQAELKVGRWQDYRESYQAEETVISLESLLKDFAYSVRQIRKSPWFSTVAAVTLAVGVGCCTVVFLLIDDVLLRPLRFSKPAELVAIGEAKPNFPFGSISYPNFLDWQKSQRSLSAMAVSRPYTFSLRIGNASALVNGEFLSEDFFSVLQTPPLLGRQFVRADNVPKADPVVLISESLWRRDFHADPRSIGRTLTLDNREFSIVGVIPANFRLRLPNFVARDIYVPIGQWTDPKLMDRGTGLGLFGIGRLKPDVSLAQARSDFAEIANGLVSDYPDTNRGTGPAIMPLSERAIGSARPVLCVLLASVSIVLILSGITVGSLFLTRLFGRRRHITAYMALVAGRKRMIRQLLCESLLLSLLAGSSILFPALWAERVAFHALTGGTLGVEWRDVDVRILLFVLAISLVSGLIFALSTIVRTQILTDGLESAGTLNNRRRRIEYTLIVSEIAMSLVLLVGAGLMLRTSERLRSEDQGFNPDNLLIFNLALSTPDSKLSADEVRELVQKHRNHLSAVKGVTSVSTTWRSVPMQEDDERLFWFDGQPRPVSEEDMNWALDYVVEPDYLGVMQLTLERGRFFSQHDDQHSPAVVVVDDVFAKKFCRSADPIGKFVRLNHDQRRFEIVGVVKHAKQWGVDTDANQAVRAEIYLPWMQMSNSAVSTSRNSTVILRYQGSLPDVSVALRRLSETELPRTVIYKERTMQSAISASLGSRRLALILLCLFATLGLVLAGTGISSIAANMSFQRLGKGAVESATESTSGRLLTRFNLAARMTSIGAGLGIVLVLVAAPTMRTLLFGVSPHDPLTLSIVSAVLAVVSLVAHLAPNLSSFAMCKVRASGRAKGPLPRLLASGLWR